MTNRKLSHGRPPISTRFNTKRSSSVPLRHAEASCGLHAQSRLSADHIIPGCVRTLYTRSGFDKRKLRLLERWRTKQYGALAKESASRVAQAETGLRSGRAAVHHRVFRFPIDVSPQGLQSPASANG